MANARLRQLAESLSAEIPPDHAYGSLSFRRAVSYVAYGAQFPCGLMLLAGPTGSGKSTVLSYLADELRSSHHVVRVHGASIKRGSITAEILATFQAGWSSDSPITLPDVFADAAQRSRSIALLIDDLAHPDADDFRVLTDIIQAARRVGTALSMIVSLSNEALDAFAQHDHAGLLEFTVATYHFEELTKVEAQQYIRVRGRLLPPGERALLDDALVQSISEELPRFPGDINMHMLAAMQKREPTDQNGQASGALALAGSAPTSVTAEVQEVRQEVERLRDKLELMFDEIMRERRRADDARAEADMLREKLHRIELEQLRADAVAAKRVMQMLTEQEKQLVGQLRRQNVRSDDI